MTALPLVDGPVRLQHIRAVVNPSSGGVGSGAVEAVERILSERGFEAQIATPEGAGLERAIREAVDAAPDLLLVLGGDGTARLAAEICGPDGPLLAAMPCGTLNMLPHVLYGRLSWREALSAALERGVAQEICGGRVAGRAFFVAAVLGAPALWSSAREAIRAGNLRRALRRGLFAFRRAFTGGVRYRLEGRGERSSEALVLICPTISRVLADDEPAFEVAELDLKSAAELFRLAFRGLTGDWRADPAITTLTAARGRASAGRRIPCILDGELVLLAREAKFEFTRRAFRALALPEADGAAL